MTDRFEVVLTGFDFETTACDTGSYGSFGGCELDTGRQRPVRVDHRTPRAQRWHHGRRTHRRLHRRRPAAGTRRSRTAAGTGFAPLGLLMISVGIAGAGCAYLWNRRRGSNDVSGAGGAADAAFGGLPQPGSSAGGADSAPTRRVTDKELARMATIEFVPPRGLEPWQGMALLRELVDDQTVLAWFSDMVAQEALVVTGSGDEPKLALGPEARSASLVDQAHLARLFATEALIDLGTYDTDFAATWRNVSDEQQAFITESGWWNTRVRGTGFGLRKRRQGR